MANIPPAELPVRLDLHLEKENDQLGPFRKSAKNHQHGDVAGMNLCQVVLECVT